MNLATLLTQEVSGVAVFRHFQNPQCAFLLCILLCIFGDCGIPLGMKKPSSAASRYLWIRPRSRWIWFRMAVPKEYQAVAGCKVVRFSLETDDRLQASILAGKRRAELFEQWGAVRTRHVPTLAELEEAAVRYGHDLTLSYEDARREGKRGEGRSGWQRYLDRMAINLHEQERFTATSDDALVRGLADAAIDELGFDVSSDSELFARFCDLLNKARLAALEVSAGRAKGRLEAEADSRLVREVRQREAAKAKRGETISELFERWAAERLAKGEKRADTVNQDRKVIEQFAAFVGKDRCIRSITPIEVAEYRDTLRDLPPKWTSNKALKALPMRDAAAKARELDLPQTAFTTVNKHLSTLSPLYKWLAQQPAWAGLGNPVTGLFHDSVKGKNRRPSFSTAQLNKMLQSALFTGFLGAGKEHLPGNQHADDWRKWIPLVCLFTGARIGEIAQLRLGDVRQERDVWFVHIRHDDGEGLSTKSRKSRPAAVHAILEKVGFLAFHQRRLEASGGDIDAPLFPELKPNARGQISGMPSRWWRDYLADIGVKDGADGFGAHSFRHTLADRLRVEAELLDDQIEVALGHNQKTTTSGYGALSQGTVTMFKAWADAVRFDGVDFSHLAETRR